MAPATAVVVVVAAVAAGAAGVLGAAEARRRQVGVERDAEEGAAAEGQEDVAGGARVRKEEVAGEERAWGAEAAAGAPEDREEVVRASPAPAAKEPVWSCRRHKLWWCPRVSPRRSVCMCHRLRPGAGSESESEGGRDRFVTVLGGRLSTALSGVGQ